MHHSTDMPIEYFDVLGLDVDKWDTRFMEDGVSSYVSPKTHKTFTIDIARLVAAVEYDQVGDMSTIQGYTTRSLLDVVGLCFETRSHLGSDNAGDWAAVS